MCTFHITQNVVKHLAEADDEESCTPKRKSSKRARKASKEGQQESEMGKAEAEENEKEPSILADFSACMYEYEDEATFQEAFNIMRTKASKQTWLDSIYKVREKWTECYMNNVYALGMRSTQLSEGLNSDLKRHFKSNFDIIRFLKHFETVVEFKRKI